MVGCHCKMCANKGSTVFGETRTGWGLYSSYDADKDKKRTRRKEEYKTNNWHRSKRNRAVGRRVNGVELMIIDNGGARRFELEHQMQRLPARIIKRKRRRSLPGRSDVLSHQINHVMICR